MTPALVPPLLAFLSGLALAAWPLSSPAQTTEPRRLVPSAAAVMDWAEARYPQLFPGHPRLQSLPPYVYRPYAGSGNFIGVAGTGIWLLGPVAGGGASPVYFGETTDLACQVYPASCSQASAYPQRPVDLLVPTAAGGPTDTLGRALRQELASLLGVDVTVTNVAGRNTLTGTQRAAAAVADGHTVLLHTVALASNTGAFRSPGQAVPSSFEYLGLVAEAPLLLFTHSGASGDTLQTVLTRARAQPGAVSIGHAGAGSVSHLCALMLQQRLGLDLRLVAYAGSAPLLTDVIGRHVDLACAESHGVGPYLASRQVHGLATLGSSRSTVAALSSLPTVAEVSPPGFTLTSWTGLAVPTGTPAVVRERLNAALRAVTATPTYGQRLHSLSSEAVTDHRAGALGHGLLVTEQARELAAVFRLAGQFAD